MAKDGRTGGRVQGRGVWCWPFSCGVGPLFQPSTAGAEEHILGYQSCFYLYDKYDGMFLSLAPFRLVFWTSMFGGVGWLSLCYCYKMSVCGLLAGVRLWWAGGIRAARSACMSAG